MSLERERSIIFGPYNVYFRRVLNMSWTLYTLPLFYFEFPTSTLWDLAVSAFFSRLGGVLTVKNHCKNHCKNSFRSKSKENSSTIFFLFRTKSLHILTFPIGKFLITLSFHSAAISSMIRDVRSFSLLSRSAHVCVSVSRKRVPIYIGLCLCVNLSTLLRTFYRRYRLACDTASCRLHYWILRELLPYGGFFLFG